MAPGAGASEPLEQLAGASRTKPEVDTSHIRVTDCRKGYDGASFFSKLFWFWMEPLFWLGIKKKALHQEDLYNVPNYSESEGLHKTFQKCWQQQLSKRHTGGKPRLWIAVVKVLWLRLIGQAAMATVEVFLQVVQAILIGWLTSYFVSDVTPGSTRDAYLTALALTFSVIAISWVHAWGFLWAQELGMLARIVTTGALYEKTLELKLKTIGELSIGKIVNLASNDVQRLDISFMFLPHVVIAPLHAVAVTLLLWLYVGLGPSCLPGMGLLLLQMPLQYLVGRLYAKLRFKSARYTDKRVKIMNQVICGIRVIKMYGWEYAFKKLISDIRGKEVGVIFAASMFRAVNMAFFYVSLSVVNLLMFSTFTLATGNSLTPNIVFTTLSLTQSLRLTTIIFMVRCILGIQEAKVAFTRIQDVLMKDLPDPNQQRRYSRRSTMTSLPAESGLPGTTTNQNSPTVTRTESLLKEEAPSITVKGLSAAWSGKSGKLTLKNISFKCDMSNRMLAIVGPVGAGKSSILHCLLGELEPIDGEVSIVGNLGYAAQEPWVYSGTLKDNILFGLPYEEEWYYEVLQACSLDEDVDQFPHRDKTLVGERGVTLSGGQKARVTLARSIYRKADVYILDDPLSAVDTIVGRRLFETCLNGVLRNSVVVLVTHQLQYAQLADTMLVLDQGECLVHGTYDQVMEMVEGSDEDSRCAAAKSVLSEMISNMTTVEEKDVFDVEDSMEDLREGSIGEVDALLSPCVADRTALVLQQEGQEAEDKTSTDGRVGGVVDFSTPFDLVSGSLYPATSLISVNTLVDSPDLTPRQQEYVNLEGKEVAERETVKPVEAYANVVPLEDKAQGSVTFRTYYNYFRAGGGYVVNLILAVVFLMTEGSIVVSDWYLSEWSEADLVCMNPNASNILCDLSPNLVTQVYSGLVGVSVLFGVLRAVLFYVVCLNAARKLHNKMFMSVLRAPVRFFDTNPIGRVLNRFSKDLGFMDDILPFFFFDYLGIMLRFLAIMIVAGAANVYVFIPVAIVIVLFVALRWYFLTTSREIKRLEAIARSPLYSHISATLQGLTTIRACEREQASIAYFHAYQDEQTKGWVHYLNANRWFGMRIDLVSSLFVTAVSFSAIPLAGAVDPGLVSLSLAYSISLAGMFQYGVRMGTEVEGLMISAERLMAYGQLQPEAPLETPPEVEKPPKTWPLSGAIRMHKMRFRYATDTPYVLNNVSLEIGPGEKIGVVGRTGAGKSSLMQALFRMAEPEGVLEVDQVNITSLGLHDLRQRLSIIPQDPVIFSGSVRYNLDPFGKHSDQEIWMALQQVQLKTAIQEMEGHLEASVAEGGSNFSVGQRQLMCLARALLKRSKILVIDEATANVDMTTDAIIQQTIRREFVDCTTLTIAHRLNTIMDSDRILVLSGGRIREFDTPHLLLLEERGMLSRMVGLTGASESARLRKIAADKYFGKQEGEGGVEEGPGRAGRRESAV